MKIFKNSHFSNYHTYSFKSEVEKILKLSVKTLLKNLHFDHFIYDLQKVDIDSDGDCSTLFILKCDREQNRIINELNLLYYLQKDLSKFWDFVYVYRIESFTYGPKGIETSYHVQITCKLINPEEKLLKTIFGQV